MDISKRSLLLESVASYWQCYSSLKEMGNPQLREWSRNTLTKGIVNRAMNLIEVCALEDGAILVPISEYTQDGDLIIGCENRNWNGIRLSFIGINTCNNVLPENSEKLLSSLSQNSLSICVLSSSLLKDWQITVNKIRRNGQFVIPVFPNDINALAWGKWTLQDLIEYKLFRTELLDKDDVESQYANTSINEFMRETDSHKISLITPLTKMIENIDDSPTSWVEHPELNRIIGRIKDGKDCIITGPSSSGKTTLGYETGLRMISDGKFVGYIDVGQISPYNSARALTYLNQIMHGKKSSNDSIIILDDLQSNPSVAKHLLATTRLLRRAGASGNTTILAITWPGYADNVKAELPNAFIVHIKPQAAQEALLAKYQGSISASELITLSETAEDDVLIWRLWLDSPSDSRPSKHDLAAELINRRVRNYHGDLFALKRALLIAALLGQYEFELTEGYLEYQACINKTTLDSIVKARVLKKSQGKLTLGHRSLCSLIGDFLANDDDIWTYLKKQNRPIEVIDIIHNFIRTSEAPDVWVILKKLYSQVGLKGGTDVNESLILVEVWKSLDSLIERIEQQQNLDPSWGMSLSSPLFAIEALSAIGKHNTARPSIVFIRDQWDISEGIFSLKGKTSERKDFNQIKNAMSVEDEIENGEDENKQKADTIDFDRFHYTWALGLLLCTESAFGEYSDPVLEKLAIAVESKIEPDGNFYPKRVPWCTARVLIGLSKCGRTYQNSNAVKLACDWLLTPSRANGPYKEGVWESGTGIWNTRLETTSMCIMALVSCGISRDDPRLLASLKYIKSVKSGWTKPGYELDGANAAKAYIALVGNWQGIVPEIQYLLRWARSEAFWNSINKSSDQSLQQSCKVATIADYLIDAAWSNLRSDLPSLLGAFSIKPIQIPTVSTGTNSKSIETNRQKSRSMIITPRVFLTEDTRIVLQKISDLIIIEYESNISDLNKQLSAIKVYEAKLKDKGNDPDKIDELKNSRQGILAKIKEIEECFNIASTRIHQAESKKEIETIYGEWKHEISKREIIT